VGRVKDTGGDGDLRGVRCFKNAVGDGDVRGLRCVKDAGVMVTSEV